MTTHDATRRGHLPPITVRPGLAVSVAIVTVLLSAITLPATVPGRPGFAYLSGGLIGAGLLVGVLLAADLMRARSARRSGVTVLGITLGAFGSRLVLAGAPDRSAGVAVAPHPTTPHPAAHQPALHGIDLAPPPVAALDPTPGTGTQVGTQVEARIARAGLLVTAAAGALLVVLGALAPAGTWELAGEVALWVGTFALLVTLVDVLPSPRSSGGRLIAARVERRTGSRARAEQAAARAGVITGWSLIAVGLVGSFLVGFVALWAVLLGWLALGTSRFAQAQQRTYVALEGLTVRDVMSPPPPPLSAWTTVASALDEVVLPSRRAVFGVEDFDGSLAGVALLRDLAAVPMDDRGLARINRVMIPLEMVATARPDEQLTDVTGRLLERPAAGCVAVIGAAPDDGRLRLIGTVGPVELKQAVETAPLRGRATTVRPAHPGGFWR
ncbi:peptidase M50 [Frankia sp. CcI156]|uniref:Conserved transmembrane alanine and leucine rich protein n=1 Tax=Frankia casuarinae (strain DSM 45818 / CECT 9043 / HFP020203 / CcI3) TaxID=106370 RepID=Q2JCI9_FRACC|nr:MULTISPECIES: alanine and leucine rich protein [Frankia]ABD11003.1 putative conserved transmembrane alanine and leucine rich protein [Frankia casuarinae]ETA00665.1 CBS domain-containing protein [Frankia sp. CcI6]EYT91373.1 CBS domain-containing protein [Frankia casuarinae]KDA41779.1 CBS domain-containing protein [Frankia sp. BMG5.23]OHV57824.1 peptidase M50 [Frankia sp. CgIS1]